MATIDGKEKYVAYTPVKDMGWSVGIMGDSEEMLSGLAKSRNVMVIITLMVLVGDIIITYCIVSRLAKRLRVLKKDVENMATGDFIISDYKNRIIDEITQIYLALNETKKSISKMLGNVKDIE